MAGLSRCPGIVPKLSDTPGRLRTPAPRLGEHTASDAGARGWRTPAPRTTTAALTPPTQRCSEDARRGEAGGVPGRRHRQSVVLEAGKVCASVVAASAALAARRARSSAARSGSPAAGGSPGAPRHRACGLDASACHAQAELARGPPGASDHRSRIVAARQRSHRGAVDLRLAHRLVRQRRQPWHRRRRNRRSTPPRRGGEALEGAARGLGVLHRRGLRQLAQQALGRHVVRLQAALGGARNRPGETARRRCSPPRAA